MQGLKNIGFMQLWDSAVLMTWAVAGVRLLTLVAVMSMVLSVYTTAEIVLWFLLVLIFSLVMVGDFGLTPTFARLISYAMGGAAAEDLGRAGGLGRDWQRQPNTGSMARLVGTMPRFYAGVTIIFGLGLMVGGGFALSAPIESLADKQTGWLTVAIVFAGTILAVGGQQYVAFLLGINQIAVLRRWELFTAVGQLITMVLVLWQGGSLLTLMAVTHAWTVFGVIRNAWLCQRLDKWGVRRGSKSRFDPGVAVVAWHQIWRSGVGIFFSFGAIQISGLIFAQFAEGRELSGYLLQLRLIQAVSFFSQAPFYTKLPRMGQFASGHRYKELVPMAERGLALSIWSFTAGFFAVAVFGELVLPFLGQDADLFDPYLWGVMGLAFFFERFGNMYMQLYSLTNHIIWHILNGVTGSIYILLVFVLLPAVGVYAFPLGILVASLACQSPVSAWLSHKAFSIPFPRFELRTSAIPLLLLISYFSLSYPAEMIAALF